jgi:hypothetical protein
LLAYNILIATGGATSIPATALTFSDNSNVTVGPSAFASAGANIDLQANNDITFQDAVSVQSGFALTAQANAAILVNASVATTGANLALDAGSGGISDSAPGEIASNGVVTLDTSGPIGSSNNRLQFDATATPAQIIVGSVTQPSGTYLAGLDNLNLGNVTSLANNGPLDVTALGNLTVLAGATLDTGTGMLSLAADTTAAGAGNDGVGILSVQANGILDAATIALRGASMSLDPAAVVGNSGSGIVTTLAGPSGQFNNPQGVAVDSAGNVYVADTYNDEVRKITPSGVVTTLAGSAGQTGSSDGTGRQARIAFGKEPWIGGLDAGRVFLFPGRVVTGGERAGVIDAD